MSREDIAKATLEGLHRDALAWVKKEGAEVRWEATSEGEFCVVALRGQERQQPVIGSDEAARQNALVHAVDELQNSMPPAVEGP